MNNKCPILKIELDILRSRRTYEQHSNTLNQASFVLYFCFEDRFKECVERTAAKV